MHRIMRAAKAAHKAIERGECPVEQLLVFSRCRVMQPSTLDFNRVLLEFESLIRSRRSSVEETRFSSTLCSQGSGSGLKSRRALTGLTFYFSDIVMPAGINGIQLAGEARRVQPTP